MKKLSLLALILGFSLCGFSQNVQLHYNLGKQGGFFTSTVEMFKPDKWGTTFLFTDMNYGEPNINGVSLAYWEIARGLKFWEEPFSFQVEYNGGFGQWNDGTAGGAFQINNAWLGGLDYSWHNADFTKGLSFQILYKYIQGKHDASFQTDIVWFADFFNKKLSLTGFASFWREDNVFETKTTDFVFISEPQVWYNFTENISLGGEIKLSMNFGGMEGFNVTPTVGAKWTF